jgi:hypothetical protein
LNPKAVPFQRGKFDASKSSSNSANDESESSWTIVTETLPAKTDGEMAWSGDVGGLIAHVGLGDLADPVIDHEGLDGNKKEEDKNEMDDDGNGEQDGKEVEEK